MPRKLKTYVTSVGFFDLAVAAPSMKAALEAWGMHRNAFQQGFAEETHDPNIVAATSAKPGTVLRRAVGTNGEFKEHAELPRNLPAVAPPVRDRKKPKAEIKTRKREPAANPRNDRAAIISFQKEKAKRERERAKEEATQARDRKRKRQAAEKARDALERAREGHERIMGEIEREREALDRRAEKEQARWNAQRRKLEDTPS